MFYKKMCKKNNILLITILAGAIALSGCGNSSNSSSNDQAKPNSVETSDTQSKDIQNNNAKNNDTQSSDVQTSGMSTSAIQGTWYNRYDCAKSYVVDGESIALYEEDFHTSDKKIRIEGDYLYISDSKGDMKCTYESKGDEFNFEATDRDYSLHLSRNAITWLVYKEDGKKVGRFSYEPLGKNVECSICYRKDLFSYAFTETYEGKSEVQSYTICKDCLTQKKKDLNKNGKSLTNEW